MAGFDFFDLAHMEEVGECASHFFFPILAASAAGTPVRIPDTILYTYSKPTAWYRYEESTKQIKKMPKKMLNSADILTQLMVGGGASSTNIKAWYVQPLDSHSDGTFSSGAAATVRRASSVSSMSSLTNSSNGSLAGPRGLAGRASLSRTRKSIVGAPFAPLETKPQHIDVPEIPFEITSQSRNGRDGVLAFLQIPKGKGVLQRYIDAKPENDGSMRNVFCVCSYSPVAFSVERVVSRHLVTDEAIAMNSRVAIHDHRYDRRPVLSPAICGSMLRVCESFAARLKAVMGYTVGHLSVTCRIDPDDKLYLLWCNSMRVHHLSVHRGLVFEVKAGTTKSMPYTKGPASSSNAAPSPSRLEREVWEEEAQLIISPNESTQSTPTSTKGKIDFPADEKNKDASGPSTLLKDSALERVIRCRVCHTTGRAGQMPRVQLKWLLFAVSYLDHEVIWNSKNDVPPSVALVCPTLTLLDFQRKVAAGLSDPWLGTFTRICDSCLKRCNVANDRMAEKGIKAPDWLHIDPSYTLGAKLGRQKPISLSPIPDGQLLTFTIGSSEVSPPGSPIRQGINRRARTMGTSAGSPRMLRESIASVDNAGAASRRGEFVLQTLFGVRRDRFQDDSDMRSSQAPAIAGMPDRQPRFAPSAKSHPEAADLYAMDASAVLKKVGFGRPSSPSRFLSGVPKRFTSGSLEADDWVSGGGAATLDALAELDEEDRVDALERGREALRSQFLDDKDAEVYYPPVITPRECAPEE